MRVLYPSELPARKRHAPYSSLSRSHIPQQGGTGANPISGRARPVLFRFSTCGARDILSDNQAEALLEVIHEDSLVKPLPRRALPISLGLQARLPAGFAFPAMRESIQSPAARGRSFTRFPASCPVLNVSGGGLSAAGFLPFIRLSAPRSPPASGPGSRLRVRPVMRQSSLRAYRSP